MMMKRLLGMIALFTSFAFVFVSIACDDGSGNGSENGNSGDAGTVDNNLVLENGYAWIIGNSPNRSGLIFQSDKTFLNVIETDPNFQTTTGGKWSVSGNKFTNTPYTNIQLANIPYSVSANTLTFNPGIVSTEVAYTKTNIGINAGDGFTISGYTGSSGATLYASTNASITDVVSLMFNTAGSGVIQQNGKIIWVDPSTGPNGTFTLYIVSAATLTKKTSSAVTITNGNGTVAYANFVNIN